MTIKDLFWSNPIRYSVLGTGAILTLLIGSKILYDYSLYTNLKDVKKQLDNIKYDTE